MRLPSFVAIWSPAACGSLKEMVVKRRWCRVMEVKEPVACRGVVCSEI